MVAIPKIMVAIIATGALLNLMSKNQVTGKIAQYVTEGYGV